jgi:hypothetical protein
MSKKTLVPLLLALCAGVGFHSEASAWASANRFGGHSYGGGGTMTHDNRWGGSTSANAMGGWSHTNADGGHSAGVAGYGGYHTTAGGFTTYHPPAYGYPGYAPYHPPVGVVGGCYNCGVSAGAVAAGVAVGAVAGAAVATAATRPVVVAPAYPVGVNYSVLPPAAVVSSIGGVTYYNVGPTWFRPYYGANGVYYTVVPAP